MKNLNLQDVFLNEVRRQKVPVTVFMSNGFQMRGLVKGFDSFTVVLDCDDKQNLIYKHAISNILPSKSIAMPPLEEPER